MTEMASPQTEDGYTRIANELLQALAFVNISGAEMQAFLVVLRKTYGFNKKEDAISLSQFCLATGMKKPNVCRALSKLIKKNMIIRIDNKPPTRYRIQKDYTKWTPLSKQIMLSKQIKSFIQIDNKSLSKQIPTKEINTKETITKEKDPLPEWIPQEEFEEYRKMRIRNKKPMTDRAVELAVKKLEKLKAAGHDPKEVLEQSTFNSWQGLFPLKPEEKKPYDPKAWVEKGD